MSDVLFRFTNGCTAVKLTVLDCRSTGLPIIVTECSICIILGRLSDSVGMLKVCSEQHVGHMQHHQASIVHGDRIG
jgi:hypothetical protein